MNDRKNSDVKSEKVIKEEAKEEKNNNKNEDEDKNLTLEYDFYQLPTHLQPGKSNKYIAENLIPKDLDRKFDGDFESKLSESFLAKPENASQTSIAGKLKKLTNYSMNLISNKPGEKAEKNMETKKENKK